jgi:hypothetical protein
MEKATGRFYKYRAIGPEGSFSRSVLREIIVESQIYYAQPSSLNDPHDCRPTTSAPPPAALRKHVEKIEKKLHKRYGKEAVKSRKNQSTTRSVLNLSNPIRRNKKVFDALDRNTGVFCTSASAVSSPQWAYYADSQQGVCLEFTVTEEMNEYPVRINYSGHRPQIDIIKFTEDGEYCREQTAVAVTTKAEAWAHEEEVRFFNMTHGLVGFNPEMLTGVIFGLETPVEYMNFVLELLREADLHPNIERIETDATNFDLRRNQLQQ